MKDADDEQYVVANLVCDDKVVRWFAGGEDSQSGMDRFAQRSSLRLFGEKLEVANIARETR